MQLSQTSLAFLSGGSWQAYRRELAGNAYNRLMDDGYLPGPWIEFYHDFILTWDRFCIIDVR
jgi:hypothetical protein